MVLSLLFDVCALFVFALEFFHLIGHCVILFRIRVLPRKDLVRQRYYFLVDTLTVFASSFLLTGRMRWLAALQIIQHLFYFVTWDNSYMAKRIIDWSSLEWFNKENTRNIELDSILGTFFDVVVHICMMYAIYPLLDTVMIIVALVIAQAALYVSLFNPKFAWSNPKNIPAWVQRRIGRLALEKYD